MLRNQKGNETEYSKKVTSPPKKRQKKKKRGNRNNKKRDKQQHGRLESIPIITLNVNGLPT